MLIHSFSDGIRRHSTLATAAVVLAAAWWWQLVALRHPQELVWLLVTTLLVASGIAALGWLRPARVGITAPQAMMLFGTIGMVTGLSLDVGRFGLDALASICSVGAPDFTSLALLHLQWLPMMHVGMIAGGLGALVWLRRRRANCRRQFCARVFQNLACSGWMILGMVAGVMLYYRIALLMGQAGGVTFMLGGMIAGMVWGMVVSVALYRFYSGLTSRRTS